MVKRCDNKGLSEVIAALLLIILVLAAATILWIFLKPVIQKDPEELTIQS